MKFFVTASIIFLATTASATEVVQRTRIEQAATSDGNLIGFKVINIENNRQLLDAGVHEGDIVQFMCGIKIDSISTFSKADRIIGSSQKKCEIKLLRNNERLTLTNDVAG